MLPEGSENVPDVEARRSTIMAIPADLEPVWRSLRDWSTEEAFYRTWQSAAAEGSDAMWTLKRRIDPASPYLKSMQDPASLTSHLIEQGFFEGERSVSVVKHPRCLPRFAHHHDFFEGAYVLEGTCRQRILDIELDLTAGDFCLIAPGVTHDIWAGENDLIINILVRTSTFADLFLSSIGADDALGRFFASGIYGGGTVPYALFPTSNDYRIRDLVLQIVREHGEHDAYAERMLTSLATMLFTVLMRYHGATALIPAGTGSASHVGTEMLTHIVSCEGDIALSELADHFGYTAPAASKIIKALTGTTFMAFAESVRLARAKRLLRETGLSVAAVGKTVGYDNVETFSRAFKRTHRVSPGVWRAQQTMRRTNIVK